MIDPDAFRPLLPDARVEIARQINDAAPNAQALVATGFGWGLAFALARQIVDGGNASLLHASGLSAHVAKAICLAIDAAIEARTPALPPQPLRTMRGAHMAGRGIRPNFSRM
jgi:hypothetical protein